MEGEKQGGPPTSLCKASQERARGSGALLGSISLQGEVRALTPSCLDRICEPPIQTSSQAGRKLRKPLSFLSPCGLFQTPDGINPHQKERSRFIWALGCEPVFLAGAHPDYINRQNSTEIILLSLREMQPRETKTFRVSSWGPFLFTALRRNP